jgi:exodeoxyribonuclease VII large subunit
MSVTTLVRQIKDALAAAFPQRVTVVGELSNVSAPASGHIYFSLKDASTRIEATMWKTHVSRLKFTPTDGLEVVVEGRVDVYDVHGKLQLYVERMTPRGAGALELAFRQLRDKLQAAGLFDAAKKKPITRFPRAVGVVTSATGAAVRDIQRTIRRRWPAGRVYLLPSSVQGESAAGEIADAIRLLDANAARLGIETIIVARGGGSLEDLWAFNEEVVARAIFSVNTPVISGVGHETDVTIADMVADVRAATPTAAAVLAVPDGEELRRVLEVFSAGLRRSVLDRLTGWRASLESVLRSVVFRDPAGPVRTHAQRVDELSHRLRASLQEVLAAGRRRLGLPEGRLAALHPARQAGQAHRRLEALTGRLRWALGRRGKLAGDALAAAAGHLAAVHPRHRLSLALQAVGGLERQLQALSYHGVLGRGFSVTRGPDGRLCRSAGQLQPGMEIETEFADGKVHSEVLGNKPKKKNKKPKGDNAPSLFN